MGLGFQGAGQGQVRTVRREQGSAAFHRLLFLKELRDIVPLFGEKDEGVLEGSAGGKEGTEAEDQEKKGQDARFQKGDSLYLFDMIR